MDQLNITNILQRDEQADYMKSLLIHFEQNKQDMNIKRGIYVYGSPGVGKTKFVIEVLKELDYDIITYDAGDIRNKSVMETITKHNMTDKNIMCMFQRKVKKIAVIMDEIDGMNQGDKGGLNALIKLIREKRTKKQRQEEITFNPIICIGNYHIDKKIKELMKVCNTIELKPPTFEQGKQILSSLIPNINNDTSDEITQFVQSDLRRMSHIYSIYENNNRKLTQEALHTIFQLKFYSEDTKNITKKLINTQATFEDHNKMMNETDRTIVGLLWHENIIDTLSKLPFNHSVRLYLKILKNICFADYIDRITFQKQIWQFNEMSSIIKTFSNNKIYHEYFEKHDIRKKPFYNPQEVRFTKVLTKYSTEYNNATFIQLLCHQLGMDKKDLHAFFYNMRNKPLEESTETTNDLFNNYNITTLDIKRIYRYLDRSIKTIEDDGIEDTITM